MTSFFKKINQWGQRSKRVKIMTRYNYNAFLQLKQPQRRICVHIRVDKNQNFQPMAVGVRYRESPMFDGYRINTNTYSLSFFFVN